jgi:ABC-type Na+ efflux pump permease subunit
MNESNGKKQVAALWILGVLVVIFIAIIVGLFITQAKNKNQEVASKDAKIAQMDQELAQVTNEFQENKNKKQNEYIEITEELRPGEVLYVTNVEKNTDNTYTLQGVIYSIYTLTYNEMEQIKSIGTFNLAGKTYNVKKNEKDIWELYDGNADFPKYQILDLNIGHRWIFFKTTYNSKQCI